MNASPDEKSLWVSEGRVLMKGHASQVESEGEKLSLRRSKKVQMTVHPEQDVMVSVGDDCNLIFWEIETGNPLLVRDLSNYPTCCQFSPSGHYLVVGFKNGTLMIFEPSISVSRSKKVAVEITHEPVTLKDKETKNAVLNIEFSDNGDLMAVSYDNLKVNREEDDILREKEGAFVYVFINKDSEIKNYKIQAENQCLYDKYTEIRLPSKNETQRVQSNVYGMAIYFMAFSTDNSYLMVYFQRVDNQQVRENRDKNGNYVVWDLNSNNLVTNDTIYNNVQFARNNFPNHVNGRYRLVSRKPHFLGARGQTSIESELEALQHPSIGVSAIYNGGDFTFLGSVDGEIFIVKNDFFRFDEVTVPEKLPLEVYCQAKLTQAHVSFVNQVVEKVSKSHRHLFTTGVHDEAIFQWEVKLTEPIWELDHFQDYHGQVDDFFLNEFDTRQKFEMLVSNLHPDRQALALAVQDQDLNVFPSVSLSLHRVIGRRAFNLRKNLFLSRNKEIVYSVGSQIVLVKLEWDRKISNLRSLQKWRDLQIAFNLESEPMNNSFVSFSLDNESNTDHLDDDSQTNSMIFREDLINPSFQDRQRDLNMALNHRDQITSQSEMQNQLSSRRDNPDVIFKQRVEGFHKRRQRFLDSNTDDERGVSEEITCLAMSPNREMVCAGVSQQRARLKFWELSSGKPLQGVVLHNCVTLNHVRYAFDNETVGCVGITSEYTACVYLVASRKQNVLAVLDLKYSLVFKIADLEFLPNCTNKFLTVGILHCSLWSFNGGALSFEELELRKLPSADDSFSEEEMLPEEMEDAQPLMASFLCVEFLSEHIFVLGDDKGFLYVFIEQLLDKKFKVHRDHPVSVIRKCERSPSLVLVGNFGGTVSLFKLFVQEREIDLLLIGHISIFKNAPSLDDSKSGRIDVLKNLEDHLENPDLSRSQKKEKEKELVNHTTGENCSQLKIEHSEFRVLREGQNALQREVQTIVFEDEHECLVGMRSGDVFRLVLNPKRLKERVDRREASRRRRIGKDWGRSSVAPDSITISDMEMGEDNYDQKIRLSRVNESDENLAPGELGRAKPSLNIGSQNYIREPHHSKLSKSSSSVQQQTPAEKRTPFAANSSTGNEQVFNGSDELPNEMYRMSVVSSFCDNEVPRACDFSHDSQYVFCISELGLFNVYSLSQLELVHQQHFKSRTVDMKVTAAHVIIAFEDRVTVIANQHGFNKVLLRTSFNQKLNYLKVSTDSSFNDWFAIALQKASDSPSRIEIYKMKNKNFEKLFTKQTEQVEFLDFSTDNLFLLAKDVTGNFSFFSLKNHKDIQTLGSDFDSGIEWQSEGLRLSEKRKAIDK